VISPAWAHGGEVHEGLAGAWTLDPLVLAPLALAALVFWSAVLRPASARYWGSIAALLVTFKISGIVCVGFLLQTPAVYEAYRNGVDDEHLGWG
jgi:hypothetical protein